MIENRISGQIIDAAYAVHSSLGPGLLESVYEEILAYELEQREIAFCRQTNLAIRYKELLLEKAFRVDLVVENRVIVELKAVETVLPLHKKQLLTYLRLSNYRLGLLINFNAILIKQGITRLVNGL
jgi:GxxExxY protein